MDTQPLDSIRLSSLEKAINQIKKEITPEEDCIITFEFLIASFFPKILDNIKAEFNRNYIEGYNAAKEEFTNGN